MINAYEPSPQERADVFLKWKLLSFLVSYFMILGALWDGLPETVQGLSRILIHPSRVTSDFFAVGGFGGTLWSAALVMCMEMMLLYTWGANMTGKAMAGILFTAGFSFHGTHVLNAFPIIAGVHMMSKLRKKSFDEMFFAACMSTCLGPLVSTLFFDKNAWPSGIEMPWLRFVSTLGDAPYSFSYILRFMAFILMGFFVGFLIAWILPILSEATAKFHRGYTLYNIGFAAGIMASIIAALLRHWGFQLEKNSELGAISRTQFLFAFLPLYVSLFLIGLWKNKGKEQRYLDLLKSSGKSADFESDFGLPLTFLNMGVMGLLAFTFLFFWNGDLNGPVVGSLLSAVAFSAIGQHPANTLPIALACGLSQYFGNGLGGAAMSVPIFSSNMAPLVGDFGILAGIAAGYLHSVLVGRVLPLHAGLNLYNNGFASGFVVAFLYPILIVLRELLGKKKVESEQEG